MVVQKLKRYDWPGTNQIPTEDKEYILSYINISSCIQFYLKQNIYNCLISEGAFSFSRRTVLLGVNK